MYMGLINITSQNTLVWKFQFNFPIYHYHFYHLFYYPKWNQCNLNYVLIDIIMWVIGWRTSDMANIWYCEQMLANNSSNVYVHAVQKFLHWLIKWINNNICKTIRFGNLINILKLFMPSVLGDATWSSMISRYTSPKRKIHFKKLNRK